MFPTLEVRWFFPGTIPPEILNWFQQVDHQPVVQPRRLDYYLRPKDRNSLGIKLREGKIEVKQRLQKQGTVRFHETVAGRLERWQKWGFALAPAGAPLFGQLMPGPFSGGSAPSSSVSAPFWSGVQKQRRLRRYELSGDGAFQALPVTDWPRRGCDFELTWVRSQGKDWWTLCLEAFGIESMLRESLFLIASRVFEAGCPLDLEATDSFGYPHWLGLAHRKTKGDQ